MKVDKIDWDGKQVKCPKCNELRYPRGGWYFCGPCNIQFNTKGKYWSTLVKPVTTRNQFHDPEHKIVEKRVYDYKYKDRYYGWYE